MSGRFAWARWGRWAQLFHRLESDLDHWAILLVPVNVFGTERWTIFVIITGIAAPHEPDMRSCSSANHSQGPFRADGRWTWRALFMFCNWRYSCYYSRRWRCCAGRASNQIDQGRKGIFNFLKQYCGAWSDDGISNQEKANGEARKKDVRKIMILQRLFGKLTRKLRESYEKVTRNCEIS